MNALSRPGLALALRLLWRDARAGELRVLAIAVVLAVAALTAVAFLTDRVARAVEQRAAESLAADLRLASARPLDPGYRDAAGRAGLKVAELAATPSVVLSGEASTLAAVRAASPAYPLRGRLRVADRLLGEPRDADGVPSPGEAWASPRLLARLGADVGVELEVGFHRVRVTRVLTDRPDQGLQFAELAPTLLMHLDDFEATGLVQPGSRVSYRMLFAGDRGAVSRFRTALESRLEPGEELRDVRDAAPQVRSAMDRAARFLNLSALATVLLSAVAVAMSARRYALRHRDRVALMKCFGASRSSVRAAGLLQLLVLGVVAAVAGCLLGLVLQAGLSWLLEGLLNQVLPPPGPAPALLGGVTALSILLGFAMSDVLQMADTPPLRVLRADLGPRPVRHWVPALAASGALLALVAWIVRDPALLAGTAAGVAATFMLLALAGWLLVRALRPLRGGGGVAWRYGLASLARHTRESVAQVVALGLGLMMLLLLTLVRAELVRDWRSSLPEDAPNQFLINIQPHEVAALEAFVRAQGWSVPDFAPMVRARLTAINGQDVQQMRFEDPEGESWAMRDANLTWAAKLQQDNRLVAGTWWDGPVAAGPAGVSLEQEFAEELGVGVGDRLEFNIAGDLLKAEVTSLRTVEWDSFRPNFFMVFQPGALDPYPRTHIASLHVPPGGQAALLDLMRTHPSVTVIDLEAALGQVRDVMDQAALAVQAVFVLTLVAGLVVMWAAVLATRDERNYESAVLRALGARRNVVLGGLAVEFVVLGALAGTVAAAGAAGAGWWLATGVLELEHSPSLALWLVGPIAGAVLVGGAGLLATRRVLQHPPIDVLRR